MTKFSSSAFITTLLALGLNIAPAQALNVRSFVSADGNDANSCTRAAPCRTLQVAHNNTAAGGEINVLDAAGYGTVTITKSISIVSATVGSASLLAPSGGTGITINAGVNDKINLRGLTIQGGNVGDTGIKFNTGALLNIQNCVIRDLTTYGIYFAPNASTKLSILNTLIADNGNAGILIQPTGSGTVTAALEHIWVDNNGSGFTVAGNTSTGSINVTLDESRVVGSASHGILVGAVSAPTALMVRRSASIYNVNSGVRAEGGLATIRFSETTITGNTLGWETQIGGTVLSYGDNNIDGNTSDGGTPPSIVKK